MANRFERLSGRTKAGILIGSLLVCAMLGLLTLEAALRSRQSWFQSAAIARGVEDFYVYDAALQLRVPRAGFRSARISINQLGFRGAEFSPEQPPGTVRIAFIGASTTFCAEVSSDENAWPRIVERMLREKYPGIGIEAINAGVPGYSLAAMRRNLELRVAPLRPDIIVIYEATNDLSMNSNAAAEAAGLSVARDDESKAWLWENSLLAYLLRKNLKVLARQWNADAEAGKLTIPSEELTPNYARELTALVRASRAVADRVALVTFSTRMHADQSPEELKRAGITALYYAAHRRPADLVRDFAAYNETARAVARAEGAALIEAAERIPADSDHFADSVHFTDQGAAVMARLVTAGIVERDWVRRGTAPVSTTRPLR
jgi:lysophospholipase L1-like esterase